jgi:broad specificity phosphatase PhoE
VSATSNQVVLVRHGDTEWSRNGRHTGLTDIPLTEEGRRNARLVGERLRGVRFVLVLTSPLQRAVETCRLTGFDGAVRQDLREWDYGDYEGRRTVDIRKERPGWSLWRDGVPRGETPDQVALRADRVIEEVGAVEGDVAVFAHGHLLRVLAARWLGLKPQQGGLFALDPATISILGYERETPVIRLWNESCAPRAR